MAVIVAWELISWLKFGSGRSLAPVGVWAESFLWLGSWVESGSRRSPGGVFLQSRLEAKSGSRRSPDCAYQLLESRTEPGSRRSPGGIYPLLMSSAKPGSRRSPGGACM